MHATMFARWQPDFLLNDLPMVIQADGDYWHSLPKAVQNDAAFNATAEQSGYTVIRLRERDIKKRPQWCQEEIIAAVQRLNPDYLPLIEKRCAQGGFIFSEVTR